MKKTQKHIILDELYHLRHEAIERAQKMRSGVLTEDDIDGPDLVGIIGQIDRSIAHIIQL